MMEKLLVKKPEPTLSKTNKPVQKKPDVKEEKCKNNGSQYIDDDTA